jgi:predicted HTH domain antitoxin
MVNSKHDQWLPIRAFEAGDLSLGQVARIFDKPRDATMWLLSDLGIPIADYDLAEDLETLQQLGGQ